MQKLVNVIPFPEKEIKPDAKWLGTLLAKDNDEILAVASVLTWKDGSTSIATTDIDLPELIVSNKFLDAFVTEILIDSYTKDE